MNRRLLLLLVLILPITLFARVFEGQEIVLKVSRSDLLLDSTGKTEREKIYRLFNEENQDIGILVYHQNFGFFSNRAVFLRNLNTGILVFKYEMVNCDPYEETPASLYKLTLKSGFGSWRRLLIGKELL